MTSADDKPIRILAADCATQPKRVGLSSGRWHQGHLTIEEVIRGDDVDEMAQWLVDRCVGVVVLGLDAPLGWPARLGDQLGAHTAGMPLVGEANDIFRRGTDTFVHRQIGKLPLDVGADRIARTAHAALRLLRDLRALTGRTFEVPTSASVDRDVAIETYPGGTLKAGPWDAKGYKRRDGATVRRRLIDELSDLITFECETERIVENDDLFDAVIGALGCADFLNGYCYEPYDAALAEREGWIWVRQPS